MGEITARDASRPPAAATVGDRLRGARSRAFVGRTAELELFRGALEDPEALSVLWVHGPGGVGKTALLAAMADAAGDTGLDAIRLDMRSIDPAPPTFSAELAQADGAAPGRGRADAGQRLAAALRPLDRPALVLWGRHDPYLPVAHTPSASARPSRTPGCGCSTAAATGPSPTTRRRWPRRSTGSSPSAPRRSPIAPRRLARREGSVRRLGCR